ncbi:MAG: zinc ABC transporter substrate-binding protein [Bacteroidales bacterium]|nr:zinc ABC transporter substrate-binding protein [Bacteroidales bacterium]
MKHIYLTLTILAMTLLAACSGKETERPVLTVSVEPQRAILREIVGDRYDVVTLIGNGANPESYEPTMKARMAVENSKAFFTTGSMPFEHLIAEAIDTANVRIVDCSQGIEPIYGTHSHHHHELHGTHGHHGHVETDKDPHIWASVRNGRRIARTMLRAIIEIDPDGREYYTARHAVLDARLDSLDRAIRRKLDGNPGAAFAIWHPSLSYYARDYGLNQIAVGFENKEMTPTHLAHVAEEAKEHGVRVFFFQKEYDSRQAETLNREMQTRLVPINPMAYDWEKSLTEITEALTQ